MEKNRWDRSISVRLDMKFAILLSYQMKTRHSMASESSDAKPLRPKSESKDLVAATSQGILYAL